jgi:putative FmdB family regulatory protein
MPIYDFKCTTCGKKQEEFVHQWEEEVLCPKCKTAMERLFPSQLGPPNFGFPEGGVTMEHVGPTPVHFATRSEAQRYAKENNMELGCL